MRDNLERIENYKPVAAFFPTIYRKFLSNSEEQKFFAWIGGFMKPEVIILRFLVSKDISHKVYCNQSVTFVNFN